MDPEVVGLCGITADELGHMKDPPAFERPAEPVPQPSEPHPDNARAAADPIGYARMAAMPDEVVWKKASETTPPVDIDA